MFASRFFLPTLKEDPAEASLISHKLMIRSGMIRQLASGLYDWLPLGLRVFRKVEAVVRDEMNKIDGLETVMPCAQPAELWLESGRWHDYGAELLRFKDRHEREFCLGPTHEEVYTELVRSQISSHRQLPLMLYQIHTKFRDEVRPRFGVMRGREFCMKDAYSFNADEESLAASYAAARQAYIKIFTRLGVDFRVVAADSGTIGGNRSEEFNVLADSGENALALNEAGSYAANVELVPTPKLDLETPAPTMELELIDTPGIYTVPELEQKLGLPAAQGVKIIIVQGQEWTADQPALVGLLIRGDRALNYVKAEALAEVKTPLTMATREEIVAACGCAPGSLGPVKAQIPLIGDYELAALADFVCGANQQDKHYKGVNWERDCPLPPLADLRNITAGEPSPDGKGALNIRRGIEVGHIFQLGDKYSKSMNAMVVDDKGESFPILMGCYGIGIDRTVAACIEQNHDARGIIWPAEIAPFDLVIVPLPWNAAEVRQQAEQLYAELQAQGLEVLFDERDLRAGNKFNNCDLLGIPYRVVVSKKSLAAQSVEVKARNQEESELIPVAAAVSQLQQRLSDYKL